MNQIDLWSGGQQSNRGSKYIHQQVQTEQVKLLCVVHDKPVFTRKEKEGKENKVVRLFDNEFKNNTLCYIAGLKKQMYHFFEINNGLNC